MVHRHQLDGLPPEQAHAVQLAAIEQHGGEAVVVVHRRDEPAAAGEKARLAVQALRGVVDHLEAAVGLALVVGGEARHLRVRDDEAGVAHAERLEHVLLEVGVELLARDDLDEMADHVGGHGVVPARARRELQRQRGERVDHVGERVAGLGAVAHGELPVRRVDVGALHEAVGEAGGVAQQIADGHGPRGGHGGEDGVVASGEDAQILPRRDELVHRIVELKAPFFVEHHEPDARDGLRHRVDAPDRVGGDGPAALDLEVAERLTVDDLAAPGHQGQGAGELAGVDVALPVLADAGEALGRDSDLFGLRGHGGSPGGRIRLSETARSCLCRSGGRRRAS